MDKRSESKVSYEDIANEAIRIINSELKSELQKYTPISIKESGSSGGVRRQHRNHIYSCSWFLDLIGGLKDLYDAVRLIKEISERYINKKLNDRFGNYFRVDTYSITPREDDFWCFEKRNMLEKGSNWKPQRDAFSIICLWRMWFYC